MKIGAALLGLIVAASTSAEWVLVIEEPQQRLYVDPGTARTSGSIVKIWELTEFSPSQTIAGQVFNSMKTQTEYDCENELRRNVYFLVYADELGKSKVIRSQSGDLKWRPVVPESIGAFLWGLVCNR
jgi:hypothetical protein